MNTPYQLIIVMRVPAQHELEFWKNEHPSIFAYEQRIQGQDILTN